MDSEKWIISFFQMPLLPKFSSRNREMINDWIKELSKREWLDELDYTRKLQRLQGDIDNVFHIPAEDSAHWLRKVVQDLYQAGVTFHSVFLPASISPEPDSRDFGKKVIDNASLESGIKNRLKEMALLTGGVFCEPGTGQEGPEPDPLLEKEDLFYTLTFSPQNPEKEDLKVEVNHPHYQVVYNHLAGGESLRPAPVSEKVLPAMIRIESMAFKDKKLSLHLGGFAVDQHQPGQDRGVGKLGVRVRISDNQERVVFDKEKALLAQKESVSLALDFKWLTMGKYNFVISASDLSTGRTWTQVAAFDVR
jgi:hypothetical protein